MALLENTNIALRALEPEDLEAMYRWENDSEIWRYGATITPYSRFALRDYLNNTLIQDIFQSRQLRLIIVDKASGNLAGAIDLYDFDPVNRRAGIGILIDSAFRRQGLGLQALKLMRDYAFQFLYLHQLYAHIPQSNLPSYRLFQKSGYQQTGVISSWIKSVTGFTDVYVMQLLNRTA
jgi:diamine N-acetyltransferase